MPTTPKPSDRVAVTDLITGYFAAVDDNRLNRSVAAGTFAADARLVRPNGSTTAGPAQILASHIESFARFRSTHHVITDHCFAAEADTIRVRANITATHLWAPEHIDPRTLEGYFVAGGVLRAVAIKTPPGWRLSHLENRVVWRTGSGYTAMIQTGARGPLTIEQTAR